MLDPAPIREEWIAEVAFKGGFLPFGTGHNVIVLVGNDIRIDAVLALNTRIVESVVRDVSKVENPKRSAPFRPPVVIPVKYFRAQFDTR